MNNTLPMRFAIRCGKCGQATPMEAAFVDRDGIIVKCGHCGQTWDREQIRLNRDYRNDPDPPQVEPKQLALKI